VIIYLHLLLNEKPGLTNFVSWHLQQEFQRDSLSGIAASVLTVALRGIKRKNGNDAASLGMAINHLATVKNR
jgi:hypothetical protein